jgi:hypothetical protein
MRSLRPPILILAAVVLLALPGSALAQDLPDAIDDPVAAIEPAAPAPAADPVPQPAPAVDPIPEIDGIPEAVATDHREGASAAATTAPARSFAPSPAATLPFTGVAEDRLVQVLLFGSLLLCAGAVLRAHAAARAELV